MLGFLVALERLAEGGVGLVQHDASAGRRGPIERTSAAALMSAVSSGLRDELGRARRAAGTCRTASPGT